MTRLITTTPGLIALARDSEGRNRGPNERCLLDLDPDGLHVLADQFVHNDVELRCRWLIKVRDDDAPHELWMDNSFDAVRQLTFPPEKLTQAQP